MSERIRSNKENYLPKLASKSREENGRSESEVIEKSNLPKLASRSGRKTCRRESEVIEKITCQNWQVALEEKTAGADQK